MATTQIYNYQIQNGTIAAAKLIGTDIDTLGTITTGSWTASVIADAYIASALTGKTYNALTLTSQAVGFTIAGGSTSKTLTVNNSIGLSGTDGSTLNVGTGGTLGTAAFQATSFFILNQTSAQSSSNFNISGAGVIGTTLSVTGVITNAGLASGSAGNFIVSNSNSLVTRTAAQVLSDIGAAPSSGSTSYIQNQVVSAQSASMWISGNGRFGTNANTAKAIHIAGNTTSFTPSTSIFSGRTYQGLITAGEPGFILSSNIAAVGGTEDTVEHYVGGFGLAYTNSTFPAEFCVGMQSAMPIRFYTNNTIKMSLLSTGEVGIGTTTPSQLLSVGSSSQFTVDTSGNTTTTGTMIVNGGMSFGSSAVTPGTSGVYLWGKQNSSLTYTSSSQFPNTAISLYNGTSGVGNHIFMAFSGEPSGEVFIGAVMTGAGTMDFVIKPGRIEKFRFAYNGDFTSVGNLTSAGLKVWDGTTKGTGSVADANVGIQQTIYTSSSSSTFHVANYTYAEQTVATSGSIQALEGQAVVSHTSGTTTLMLGVIGNIQVNGSGGTTTWARGVQGGVATLSGSTVTNLARFYASAGSIAGTVTNSYSFYAETSSGIASINDGLVIGKTTRQSSSFLFETSANANTDSYWAFTNSSTGNSARCRLDFNSGTAYGGIFKFGSGHSSGPLFVFYTQETSDIAFYVGGNNNAQIRNGGIYVCDGGFIANSGSSVTLYNDVQSRNWSFRASTAASNQLVLNYDGTGDVGNFNPSTGAYTATSDINRKTDIELSNIGLTEVLGLETVLYRMKVDEPTSDKQLGFIAQQVRSFIPQAYVETPGMIGLTDRPIIAALTKAIQELNKKFEDYKSTHP
jgi:hypothetical protein